MMVDDIYLSVQKPSILFQKIDCTGCMKQYLQEVVVQKLILK